MGDPTSWEGDFDDLVPVRERLVDEPLVCERVFSSKHEAFLAGSYLAERQAGGLATPGPDAG